MQHRTGGAFLVKVQIKEEEESGLFFATSADMPELMLGHDSLQTLTEELPAVIQYIAEQNVGSSVLVTRIERDKSEPFLTWPWVVIPAAIIDAERQRALA